MFLVLRGEIFLIEKGLIRQYLLAISPDIDGNLPRDHQLVLNRQESTNSASNGGGSYEVNG